MGKVSPKIFGAIVVGFAMVVTAFLLSLQQASTLSAAETDKPSLNKKSVRTFIPITDNDNNSVPDWRDVYNIETIDLDSLKEEGPYSPESKTGQAAIAMAENFLQSYSGNPYVTSSSQPWEETIEQLNLELREKDYSIEDILITEDNSLVSLRNYSNKVANIMERYSADEVVENELVLFNRLMTIENPESKTKLETIAGSYKLMLEAMLETPVPSSMTREHLSLVNVYQALHNDITAFSLVLDDALVAMMRLRRYPSDAEALYFAITNLYTRLDGRGVTWNETDDFYRVIKVSGQ